MTGQEYYSQACRPKLAGKQIMFSYDVCER